MTRQHYGTGSIYYEAARGKYRAAIIDPTGKRKSKRFNTRQEAQEWLAIISAEIYKDVYIPDSSITLGDWIMEYLGTYKAPFLRPKSLLRYYQTLKHIQPIADVRLQDMTAFAAQRFLNKLEGSDNQRQKVYVLLNAAAEKAAALDIIRKNFMTAVEIKRPKQKEVEIFTQREVLQILDFLRNPAGHLHYKRFYSLIYFAASTGARLGECLGLHYGDIDADHNIIHIRRSLQEMAKGLHEMPPKTETGRRDIPVTPDLIKTLTAERGAHGDDDYVFRTRRDTPYFPTSVQRSWRSILRLAEVQYRKFHALRHTFASQMVAANVPLPTIAKYLGHANASFTLDVYTHAIPGNGKLVAEAAEKILLPHCSQNGQNEVLGQK